MTSVYQDRIHIGLPHESAVHERLESEGWNVQSWGQGILTDEIRQAFLGSPRLVMWRWTPDLIATRGSLLRLVDAKSDLRSDTPNFSLEVAAWATHTSMAQLGVPIIYVWPDFTVNTPGGIIVKEFRDGQGANGSKTPFVLIRKADQKPWAYAFPPLEPTA